MNNRLTLVLLIQGLLMSSGIFAAHAKIKNDTKEPIELQIRAYNCAGLGGSTAKSYDGKVYTVTIQPNVEYYTKNDEQMASQYTGIVNEPLGAGDWCDIHVSQPTGVNSGRVYKYTGIGGASDVHNQFDSTASATWVVSVKE